VTEARAIPRRSPRALAALLAVTVIWGWTFVWMKQSLDAARAALGHPGGAAVVSLAVSVRFAIAAGVLALWPRARVGLDRGAWRGGLILGVILAVGFFLQMLGLQGVTPPVSAFLTSLYVVFAAILTSWLNRARPRVPFLIGVALATLGAGFIEGPPHLTFGVAEGLTIASAVVFAAHILATDRLTRAHAPLAVTLTMFVVTAALSLLALAGTLGSGTASHAAAVVALLHDSAFVVPVLLSSLLATVVALTLMNVFQREIDPIRAAIVYALEPIWTTLIAWSLGLGAPTGWLLLGGGALLAGNIVAELETATGGRE
jgi:drug/metabolite transporter (DMT)-like permease